MRHSLPASLRDCPKPGHAALRIGRNSIAGQLYLVTFTTHRRQPLFSDFDLAMDAAREIADSRSWTRSTLLAWVLMPDHWHGLIELGEGEALPALMRHFKSNVSRRLRSQHPNIGPLWGKSFHDRALRADEAAMAAARYIVMNPVRAGLVGRVGEYPFWDAVWV